MLGIHVRKIPNSKTGLSDGLSEMFDELKFAESAQVFLLNPFSGANTLSDEDMHKIAIIAGKKHIIAHGSYVDNPWNSESVELIRREFELCYKTGIQGLVVHLGNNTNKSIKNVLEHIMKFDKRLLAETILWLEINSVKSNANSFETPEKINKLFEKITSITNKSQLIVGLCIDTAHLWSCGTSLTTYTSAKKFLSSLNDIPIMFHLNDSKSEFSSGKDVHECITKGKIWSDIELNKSGLKYIAEYALMNNSIIILERENINDIKHEIKILEQLGLI